MKLRAYLEVTAHKPSNAPPRLWARCSRMACRCLWWPPRRRGRIEAARPHTRVQARLRLYPNRRGPGRLAHPRSRIHHLRGSHRNRRRADKHYPVAAQSSISITPGSIYGRSPRCSAPRIRHRKRSGWRLRATPRSMPTPMQACQRRSDSGAIEAGCKSVVGARRKRSGMFRTARGANAIIALRCRRLNGRFEDYWEHRRAPRSCLALTFMSHARLAY